MFQSLKAMSRRGGGTRFQKKSIIDREMPPPLSNITIFDTPHIRNPE